MTGRVGCVLGWATVALVAAGCTAESDRDDRPGAAHSEAPSGSTAVELGATGSAAPVKGEPGFEALARCFGRPATILGSDGDDRIVGTRREDVIITFGGDDRVSGLRKDDRVCTSGGDDVVADADHWQVTLDLGSGDDRLVRAARVAEVYAGPGGDALTISAGSASTVSLGPGDDTLRVLPDGRRHHPFNTPCPGFRSAVRPMHVDLLRGHALGQGHDRLVNVHCVRLGRFTDTVVGSAGRDDIDVGGGDDRVRALGGNDNVYSNAGSGADVFLLGPGDDFSMPGGSADRVYGGPGNDFVEASNGPDFLDGGGGNDVLHASYRCDFGSSAGAGTVDTFPNELFGGPGDDYLTGDLGNDRLDGGPGLDRGQGGFRDGRIDLIDSVEKIVRC